MKQGCRYILLSKLFLVKYNSSSPYLGVIKYNRYLSQISKKLIPLGGINSKNLLKLNNVSCIGSR